MENEPSPILPAHDGLRPGRLWSLWDMIKYKAKELVALGEEFAELTAIYVLSDYEGPDDPGRQLHEHEKKGIVSHLTRILALSEKIGLRTTRDLVKPRIEDIPRTHREFLMLRDAFFSEIGHELLLFVPHHVAKYYEWNGIVSDNAIKAFPNAYEEIRNSGTCLAAGLHTASVFHAMRAAEIAVRVLGVEIGVSFPHPLEQVEWHVILEQIGSKIAAIGNALPKGKEKSERLRFYSEAASQLRYFKDGWRVFVAHARATYNEPQALLALDHVRELLEAMKDHVVGEALL